MFTQKNLSRRDFLKAGSVAAGSGLLGFSSAWAGPGKNQTRPNILWITSEDIGPELGCYGDKYAVTPNIDKLASIGMRYRVAWSNAPVCAPARTTIITGVYPASTGSQHMRSEVKMPSFMKMYPQFLREKGYYCTNNNKEDYNLIKPSKVWDDSSSKAHWKNRPQNQPFFSIFNITTSHESQIRTRPHKLIHDPAKAPIPAYHPDTPEVRHDWAQYYDKITEMDAQAGERINELEEAGLMDDTIIFFYSDHGSGMPRSKRWPYNSGLHVGMIVYVPEKFRHLAPKEYKPGGVSERLVGFIDLAPTLLSLAEIKPPEWIQGHTFMGKYEVPPQPYLFGFRGRMDERYDMVRSVRNQRYIYIRNYMPHLIYGQYIDYMFQTPTTRIWKQLYDEGKLNPVQSRFWEPKPPEELYDLNNDADEIVNLIDSSEHQPVLKELRSALREHILKVRDVGFLSEFEMHRRSEGSTIYEMCHDPKKYPLEKIMAMADIASLMKPDVLEQLRDGLKDDDCAIRYWAAMGFLMRGAKAINFAHNDLCAALKDESPSVRIVAAQALGQYGSDEDADMALNVLLELASIDNNDFFVTVPALNAIDAMDQRAKPVKDKIKSLPQSSNKISSRMRSYIKDLKNKILVDLD
jgi:arylsulfatase A-like enzyme